MASQAARKGMANTASGNGAGPENSARTAESAWRVGKVSTVRPNPSPNPYLSPGPAGSLVGHEGQHGARWLCPWQEDPSPNSSLSSQPHEELTCGSSSVTS